VRGTTSPARGDVSREPFWSWPSRVALAAPRRTLVAAAVLVVAAAPGLARLELRTDGAALVPAGEAAVETDRAVRRRFGVRDRIAIVLRTDDPRGIYNPATLARAVALTRALEALPGVGAGGVQSLANEGSDRVYTGTLRFRPWLDPLPANEEDLARLRRDLEDIDLYAGTLIASDRPASAATILVDVPPDADRRAFYREIRRVAETEVAAGTASEQAGGAAGAASEPAADLPAGVGRPGPEGSGADRVLVVGAPVVESMLGDHVLADLATLVPLCVLVLTAVFYAAFRSWTAVSLPALEVVAALVFTFGLMGWLGVPVYLTVTVLPVILTAVGVADELHVFTTFLRKVNEESGASSADGRRPETTGRAGEDAGARAAAATMDEMARPVVLTSLTTAAGFLSFATSPIGPVRVFGVFMAIGVVFCMAWSLTVIPASLALVPMRGRTAGSARAWRASRLARGALAIRRSVLAAAALLLLAAPFAIRRVEVQDGWIASFAEGSEIRRATDEVEGLFGGVHVLRIALDGAAVEATGEIDAAAVAGARVRVPAPALPVPDETLIGHRLRLAAVWDGSMAGRSPPPVEARIASVEREDATAVVVAAMRRGSLAAWLPRGVRTLRFTVDGEGRLLEPSVLRRAATFEEFLSSRDADGVGKVLGPHGHLATMHHLLRGRRAGEGRVPDTFWEVSRLAADYRRVRGEERLREVFAPGFREGLVTVLLRDANFKDTARLLAAVRDFATRELAPWGLQVRFAGDVAASQAMIAAIVRTQLASLLLSLATVALLMIWVYRSPVLGLLAVAPVALAVIAIFAAMGAAGVPLGVASSMFAATALGIGIDYAIHLVERVRRAWRAGAPAEAGVREGVAATAPAILIDALAVGAAFGALTLSRVPASARLGGLVAVAIAVSLVATLWVLPGLLVRAAPRS
jgi:predicted RND superfamily exporter protein